MPDDRPQYDTFKRPSPITCMVGVVVALLIWLAIYVSILVIFPQLREALTYPLLALALLIVAGGGIYYFVTNRRRKAEHAAQYEQRAKSDN